MSFATVGIFAGGIVIGATGAYLIRPNVAPVPSKATQEKPLSKLPNFETDIGYSAPDQRIIGPGGYPGPISDFLRHAAYISSYDRRLRHPSWTAEHLTAASLAKPPSDGNDDSKRPDRKNSIFHEDDRIPLLFRAKMADYFRSGYDRGHMVPAADAKISQEALNETFILTNICPQVGEGFNRDYWAHFEDFTRRLIGSFGNVYVFTIPLYLPRQASDGKWRISYEVIGNPPNISVPTHFAKVIYADGSPSSTQSASSSTSSRGIGGLLGLGTGAGALGAFVMPNAVIPNEAPLKNFVVPVDSVERAAGLNLFPPAMKTSSRALCEAVDCQIIVRDFSNRNKNQQQQSPA